MIEPGQRYIRHGWPDRQVIILLAQWKNNYAFAFMQSESIETVAMDKFKTWVEQGDMVLVFHPQVKQELAEKTNRLLKVE